MFKYLVNKLAKIVYVLDENMFGAAGRASGLTIQIAESHRNDVGVHKHEMEHVRQWIANFPLHGFMYKNIKKYRLWAEVEAYKIQMQHPDKHGNLLRIEVAAGLLMWEGYKFNLTYGEALALLGG